MAHDSENIENRIAATKLLNKLAAKFGRELCESFVTFELMSMADDPEQKVRKITIQNFVKVCETVSTEFFVKKLLPVYQRLGKDSYWPVREAAVNILFQISTVSPIEIRDSTLSEIYKSFCNDTSQFVRKAAMLQLGHFLYTLKGTKINPFLIQLFVSLDPKLTTDEDLIYHCAFTFPAVLLSLGTDSWVTLKSTYKNLVKKESLAIKQSLAASIHEIAKILGGKITIEDLDLIIKGFLNDPQTAPLCFNHLHEILAVIGETKEKLTYLDLVERTIKYSKWNWRLREIFAQHAVEYAKLFEPAIIHEKIIPIIYKLLEDDVIEVRLKMSEAMYSIAMQIKSDPKYFEEVMNYIMGLYQSSGFRNRQTFLYICTGFMCNEALFDQYLLTSFLALQKDRVLSVRISLAKILQNHMKNSGVLAKNTYINRTLELLQNDPAREVRECVLAASIECDKMKEIEEERQKEIEREQVRKEVEKSLLILNEHEPNNILGTVDEEEVEEQKRQKAEKIVKETMKVDEVDEKLNKTKEKGGLNIVPSNESLAKTA